MTYTYTTGRLPDHPSEGTTTADKAKGARVRLTADEQRFMNEQAEFLSERSHRKPQPQQWHDTGRRH